MIDYDRFFIQIKKTSKPILIRQRKDFMALLLKMMSGDEAAEKEMNMKFGVSVVSKLTNSNDMTILVDGEKVYKI